MAHSALPGPTQPRDPANTYRALLEAGTLAPDPAQAEVTARLQALHEELLKISNHQTGLSARRRRKTAPPRSLYIWGNVGRGKSMLMDLFFAHAPVEEKRRIHFHMFMQQVHARLHEIRVAAREAGGLGDPLSLLCGELARDVRLLCFDELQATDVADASLLLRLFEGLFAAGVVIVSTSNHPPANLYTGGVQRERFDKFVRLVGEKMDIVALTSPHDYRTQQMKSLSRTYFWPLGRDADRFLEEALGRLSTAPADALALEVQGRTLHLRRQGEVIVASFRELCEQPLGAADYLAIARATESLALTGIPMMIPEKRNEAKRFMTLIDVLYEHKMQLLCTAAAPPERLYPEGDGSFEFRRTASRLIEMQSEKYLAQEE